MKSGMGKALVYLDQNYWSRLLDPRFVELAAFLAKLSEERRALFPVSAIHLVETMKAPPERRGAILDLMTRLSQGWCLRNPIAIMHLEFDRYRYGREVSWVRSELVTKDPIEMMGSAKSRIGKLICGLVARRVDLKLFTSLVNGAMGKTLLRDHVNAILERGACRVNAGRGQQVRLEQTAAAQMLGVSSRSVPSTDSELRRAFPSWMVRAAVGRAIVSARSSGFEPNDITDLGFISATLPYFDVITTDRRMGVRIREAEERENWAFPSQVVSEIDRLGEALRLSVAA